MRASRRAPAGQAEEPAVSTKLAAMIVEQVLLTGAFMLVPGIRFPRAVSAALLVSMTLTVEWYFVRGLP